MADENYWKHAYSSKWIDGDKRVEEIRTLIKNRTGKETAKVGFAADTTAFISGSAASHGHKKGDADLQIINTNIYLEVTGPQVKTVKPDKPLWIRPDKLETACSDADKDTWVIHVLPTNEEPLIRVVHCDTALCDRFRRGQFSIDRPTIRGRQETYVSIPANDSAVRSIEELLKIITEV